MTANPIAVGVTTAPRRDSLLIHCCKSLRQAGFEQLTVAAEPGSDLAGLDPDIEVTHRSNRLGAWHNWRTMCRELLERSTSPIILTVQDDTIFSRESLTRLLDDWPTLRDVGFVSLYTASHYQRKWVVMRGRRAIAHLPDLESAKAKARRHKGRIEYRETPIGTHAIKTGSLWGACALAFPRDVLKKLIDHRIARHWRGADRQRATDVADITNVDTAIGRVVNAMNLQMFFVNPSLSQHAARHSTLNHGGLGGRRQAWRVAPDLLDLVSGATSETATIASVATTRCCGE